MITINSQSIQECTKQKHFNYIKINIKKHGYYLKPEEFYHPGYQQWFTTSSWIIGKKSYLIGKKQLFTFRYSDGVLLIYEYKKQDFQLVKSAATILFGTIEGLNCIIEDLYCNEPTNGA